MKGINFFVQKKDTLKILILAVSLLMTLNLRSQFTCDQITLVGAWEEEQDLLSAMLAEKRAIVFGDKNQVMFFVFNPEIGDYSQMGEGKYKLNHPHFPTLITFSDLSISIFKTEGDISFRIITLNDYYFEWEGLFGIPLRYNRKFPEPRRYTYSIVTKKQLFDEILKRPNVPSEVYSYLSEPLLAETREQLSNLLSGIPTRNIYYIIAKEVGSFSITWVNEEEQKIAFEYFKILSNNICQEVDDIEAKKDDHWERWDWIRIRHPEEYKNPKVKEKWDNEFYALVDEQRRLEAIRRSALLELGLLKVANPDFLKTLRN